MVLCRNLAFCILLSSSVLFGKKEDDRDKDPRLEFIEYIQKLHKKLQSFKKAQSFKKDPMGFAFDSVSFFLFDPWKSSRKIFEFFFKNPKNKAKKEVGKLYKKMFLALEYVRERWRTGQSWEQTDKLVLESALGLIVQVENLLKRRSDKHYDQIDFHLQLEKYLEDFTPQEGIDLGVLFKTSGLQVSADDLSPPLQEVYDHFFGKP